MCIPKCRMKPTVREVLPRAVGGTRVDLLVGVDDSSATLGFADAIPEVGYQFLECPDLGLGGPVTIKITDEADSESDVIQVVTSDMAAIELCCPAATYFDPAVTGAMSISDDEMVGQTVLHMTDSEVIDVKNPGISLTGAAVMDDDIFPATSSYRGSIDGGPSGGT